MPHSAAGWRMEPPVSVPRARGAWQPATAAAEPPDEPPGTPLGVPWIAAHLIGAVLRGRTHGELVHVGLAEEHGVFGFQALDHMRIVWRDEVAQNPGRTGRDDASGAEHVLDGHGHAGQFAERLAGLALRIDGCRLLADIVVVEEQERLEFRLARACCREERVDDVASGRLAGRLQCASNSVAVFSCSDMADLSDNIQWLTGSSVSNTAGTAK